MALTDADVTSDGSDVTVDLTWLSSYALSPATIGCRFRSRAMAGRRKTTACPHSGRIPTTKWITGTQVRDRHIIHIPDRPRAAEIHVVVYDAFNRSRLPVLDDRLQGDGQRQSALIGRLNLEGGEAQVAAR